MMSAETIARRMAYAMTDDRRMLYVACIGASFQWVVCVAGSYARAGAAQMSDVTDWL